MFATEPGPLAIQIASLALNLLLIFAVCKLNRGMSQQESRLKEMRKQLDEASIEKGVQGDQLRQPEPGLRRELAKYAFLILALTVILYFCADSFDKTEVRTILSFVAAVVGVNLGFVRRGTPLEVNPGGANAGDDRPA